jgi:hypothetical protein
MVFKKMLSSLEQFLAANASPLLSDAPLCHVYSLPLMPLVLAAK